MRSSVDLPEPERPSSPTISPSRKVRSTLSSTISGAPEGLVKARWTPRSSISAGAASAFTAGETAAWTIAHPSSGKSGSVEAHPAFRQPVERAPEQAVEQDHQHRHQGDAEDDAGIVALCGHLGDIGAESPRGQGGI